MKMVGNAQSVRSKTSLPKEVVRAKVLALPSELCLVGDSKLRCPKIVSQQPGKTRSKFMSTSDEKFLNYLTHPFTYRSATSYNPELFARARPET
jgi:hypothetical protein